MLAELLLAAALALGALSPGESPEDRVIRLARVAVALELEARSRAEASDALAAMVRESGLELDVHTGERRGKIGELCHAQISPTNARFSEDLAGLELEPTRRCVAASLWTLRVVRGHCWRQHYRTHLEAAMHTAYIHGPVRCRPSKAGRARAGLARHIASAPWVVTDPMRDAVSRARLEALEASPAPAADLSPGATPDACATPPTKLRARPRGWQPPARVTRAQARFARSLLGRPLGTWRERRIAGRRVGARVEWHCSADRGWHEGVSVFVRGGPR